MDGELKLPLRDDHSVLVHAYGPMHPRKVEQFVREHRIPKGSLHRQFFRLERVAFIHPLEPLYLFPDNIDPDCPTAQGDNRFEFAVVENVNGKIVPHRMLLNLSRMMSYEVEDELLGTPESIGFDHSRFEVESLELGGLANLWHLEPEKDLLAAIHESVPRILDEYLESIKEASRDYYERSIKGIGFQRLQGA